MGDNESPPIDSLYDVNKLKGGNCSENNIVEKFIEHKPLEEIDVSTNGLTSPNEINGKPKELIDTKFQNQSQSTITLDADQFVNLRILFKKEKYDIPMKRTATIKDLKEEIFKRTGLHITLQKIMFKGLTKDEQTLSDLNVIDGSKFMVIGSSLNDILSIRPPDKNTLIEESINKTDINPLLKQTMHKKVLDKGKPEDVMIGIKNIKEPLPKEPLSGMLVRGGGKCRLTFKLEIDELWIGTKEQTQKIPLSSIVTVISEPIPDNEEYHVMALQLGPTEASRYWIYWVPAQYIDAIKKAIYG